MTDPTTPLPQALPAEEVARFTDLHDALLASGYRDVDEHNGLRPGARVRRRSEQWPGSERGTGTVLAVTQRENSPWSQSWHMPDVELIVLADSTHRDDGSHLSQLAQYHLALATRPAAG